MIKPKIITLCGSTRFKDEFNKKIEEFTLQNIIVLSVGIFGHSDDKYKEILTSEVKKKLDWLHFKKIDLCD